LDKLFSNSPSLAARVFKYLSVVLEMKLRIQLQPLVDEAEQKRAAAEQKAGNDKKSKKDKKKVLTTMSCVRLVVD
jgi:hypothetical protein